MVQSLESLARHRLPSGSPLGKTRRLLAGRSERARSVGTWRRRTDVRALRAAALRWATGLDGELGETGARDDTLLGAVHAGAESLV